MPNYVCQLFKIRVVFNTLFSESNSVTPICAFLTEVTDFIFLPRGHGNQSCKLIASKRGTDFPISDHSHCNGGKPRGKNC